MIAGLLAASMMPLTLLMPRWLASPTAQVYGDAIREAAARKALHTKIAVLVAALAEGDEAAALDLWALPNALPELSRLTLLAERRKSVIRDLIAAGINVEFQVLNVQWWTAACCDGPGVTDTYFNADGARVDVQLYNRAGLPFHYMFDIFDLSGEANWGQPARWAIHDVYRLYPSREEPLFWRIQYAPAVRALDWPPGQTTKE
ncbi:MAG: hypothetical protein JW934_12110 [Anaerolineae bacterium]|nr:hypothetical protein [Anaerolineae bacterium]